jgi:hypothetical protein
MFQHRQRYFASQQMLGQHGSNAWRYAQDLTVAFNHAHGATAAVIDGAKNFIGPKGYEYPDFAALRGLPEGTLLNGGELASTAMQLYVQNNPTVWGADLIAGLNAAIADVYQTVGLKPDLTDRGRLFTGYIGHVFEDEPNDEIVITTVGDCYAAVNGEIVAGTEKLVDQLFNNLIDRVRKFCNQDDRQVIYELLMPRLNARQFLYQNEPNLSFSDNVGFYIWLVGTVAELVQNLVPIDRDEAEDLVMRAVSSTAGQLWYPAVDGSETPAGGIQIVRLPRRAVRTIVMWTDGNRPKDDIVREFGVSELADLEPTDPEHSERAAILLTDPS